MKLKVSLPKVKKSKVTTFIVENLTVMKTKYFLNIEKDPEGL